MHRATTLLLTGWLALAGAAQAMEVATLPAHLAPSGQSPRSTSK
jgi:hypothetical protein